MRLNESQTVRTGCSRSALLALLAGVLASACATDPQSYVVLLGSPDGSVGKIVVSGTKGAVVVEQARYGANLDGSTEKPYALEEHKIKADFGTALVAQPPLPATFMLYFHTGTTRLTAASEYLVPALLEAVKNHPAADVSIIGHADTVGRTDANEALGLRRAHSVARLILQAGSLNVRDVTVISHGERDLLVKTPDNTPEARNRRAEITVR